MSTSMPRAVLPLVWLCSCSLLSLMDSAWAVRGADQYRSDGSVSFVELRSNALASASARSSVSSQSHSQSHTQSQSHAHSLSASTARLRQQQRARGKPKMNFYFDASNMPAWLTPPWITSGAVRARCLVFLMCACACLVTHSHHVHTLSRITYIPHHASRTYPITHHVHTLLRIVPCPHITCIPDV